MWPNSKSTHKSTGVLQSIVTKYLYFVIAESWATDRPSLSHQQAREENHLFKTA